MTQKREVHVTVEIRTPDARRHASDSAVRATKPIDLSMLAATDIPIVPYRGDETGGATVEIPAVVELQARLTGLDPIRGGLKSSWVAWAGPRHENILNKMRDVTYLESALGPICQMMVKGGARRGAAFWVFFCPVRVGGKEDPYFDCEFHCMDPVRRERINQEVMDQPFYIPRLRSAVAKLLFGTPWFPSGYLHDPLHTYPLYDELRAAMGARAGEMVADGLWSAWIVGNSTMTFPLAKQGIQIGTLRPTRIRAATEIGGRPQLRSEHRTLWGGAQFLKGDPELSSLLDESK